MSATERVDLTYLMIPASFYAFGFLPIKALPRRFPLESHPSQQYSVSMKTTIDIPEELLNAVQTASNTHTKKEAVTVALQEYLRLRRSEELTSLLGTFDAFIDRQELETLRGNS